DLANGATAVLTIQAKVNSSSAQFNRAQVSAADQFDPNTGNNRADALEVPQQADLAVLKSVDNPKPNVLDTIHYTIKVTNAGPDAATNVTIQDVLPTEVSYQSSTASQGSYNPGTRTWTVGTVAAGATETLIITAQVISANPTENTASISHSDQFDPNPGNDSDTASVDPQVADLALIKSVSDPRPNVNDQISFTVELINNGPNDATAVQVTDLLPPGLTFVSATPSQGMYDHM